jgi:WD40 repeat protein
MWVAQRSLDLANSGIDYVTTTGFTTAGDVAGFEDERRELLLCGSNDGRVIAVDMTGMAQRQEHHPADEAGRDVRVVVPAAHIRPLWQHTSCVLSLTIHESLVATSDDNGHVIVACNGEVVAKLDHDPVSVARLLDEALRPSATDAAPPMRKPPPEVETFGSLGGERAVRAVLLWDGFASWTETDPDAEAAAVYLFAGADDGFARLWRVHITSGEAHVIAVFGPPRAHDVSSDSHDTPSIFSLTLDVQSSRADPHGRLVAGTGNCWWAWSLEGLAPTGLRRRPPADVVGSAVWAFDFSAVELARGGKTFKPKVRSIAGARDIGTVAENVGNVEVASALVAPVPLSPEHALPSDAPDLAVTFSRLRKNVEWPVSVLRRVEAADAYGVAHAGPTYSIKQLSVGLIATAGADGKVFLMKWNSDGANPVAAAAASVGGGSAVGYVTVGSLQGHTDLVKGLQTAGAPGSLLSASYDGTVRLWQVGEHVARCASVLFVEQGSQPLTRAQKTTPRLDVVGGGIEIPSEGERETARHSVSCATLVPEASVLFTVSLFERVVRTFMLLEVDTCSPPPGFLYNGARTIRAYNPKGDDSEGASTTDLDPFGARRAGDEAMDPRRLFGSGSRCVQVLSDK